MRRWAAVLLGLCIMALPGCGTTGETARKPATAPPSPSPSGDPSAAATWTRENVAGLFIGPAQAGLDGGESSTVPPASTDRLAVCMPLNPLQGALVVPIDRRYATAGRDISLPHKGHLFQRGWVLPSTADASRVMRQVRAKLSRCRYSGTITDPADAYVRISSTSTTHRYPKDAFGWHGHRIEVTMVRDGRRASVTTALLLQRGPVLLSLDYINYDREATEERLRAYNLGVLRKVLTHPV